MLKIVEHDISMSMISQEQVQIIMLETIFPVCKHACRMLRIMTPAGTYRNSRRSDLSHKICGIWACDSTCR